MQGLTMSSSCSFMAGGSSSFWDQNEISYPPIPSRQRSRQGGNEGLGVGRGDECSCHPVSVPQGSGLVQAWVTRGVSVPTPHGSRC